MYFEFHDFFLSEKPCFIQRHIIQNVISYYMEQLEESKAEYNVLISLKQCFNEAKITCFEKSVLWTN